MRPGRIIRVVDVPRPRRITREIPREVPVRQPARRPQPARTGSLFATLQYEARQGRRARYGLSNIELSCPIHGLTIRR